MTSTYNGLAWLPWCGNEFQEAAITCVRHQALCHEGAKPGRAQATRMGPVALVTIRTWMVEEKPAWKQNR